MSESNWGEGDVLSLSLSLGQITNQDNSGWTTSAKLRQVLISFVARELNTTYRSAPPSGPSSDAIEAAIKTGFNRLDHEIVYESVAKVFKANSKLIAAEMLAPALSGSCALLSFYDSNTKLLRVAVTGDSRAILGTRPLLRLETNL